MRIVVWNCNMALHRKWDALTALKPDLAILPEAAAPDVLRRKGVRTDEVSTVWGCKAGGNPNKGLLVAAFGGLSVSQVQEADPLLDVFLPVRIEGRLAFDLLAVWSFNRRAGTSQHPIPDALDRYERMIAGGAVVVGDFNHNVRWDRGGPRDLRPSLHRLEAHGHRSVYHDAKGEAYGEEREATIYWRDRRADGPRYHIDYLFEPAAWRGARRAFSTGTYADWIGTGLSDHVPLIADWDDQALAPVAAAA